MERTECLIGTDVLRLAGAYGDLLDVLDVKDEYPCWIAE